MNFGKLKTTLSITLTGFSLLFASCGKTTTTVVQVVTVTDSLKVGLVAWYPFNNSAADGSANGYNGSVHNINSTTDRNGNANSAYYFDGLTSYITVPDNADLRLNNTDFTLNAWVKTDSYNQSIGSAIFSKRASGTINGGWQFILTGNTATPIGVVSYGADAANSSAFGSRVITLNKWHMLTAEYTLATKTLSIYVDGVLDNVTTNIVPANNLTSSALYIGKDSALNSFFFQGSLDDLRIYNRALPLNQLNYLLLLNN